MYWSEEKDDGAFYENFQVNNRRLWINSAPNTSITVLSTDKYGTGTTEAYIKLQENSNIDYRVPLERYHNFKCGDKTPMFIDFYSWCPEGGTHLFCEDSDSNPNL